MADQKAIDVYNREAATFVKKAIGTEQWTELKKFFAVLNKGDTILDIGCAGGRDTQAMSDAGFEAIGLDLADKFIEIARKEHPTITFVKADALTLPFDDETFGGLWVSAMVSHLTNDEMPIAFKEWRRVLRPGGILYIHTKMGEGQLVTNEESVGRLERTFHLVTRDQLSELAKAAHFSEIETWERPSKSRPSLAWLDGLYRAA